MADCACVAHEPPCFQFHEPGFDSSFGLLFRRFRCSLMMRFQENRAFFTLGCFAVLLARLKYCMTGSGRFSKAVSQNAPGRHSIPRFLSSSSHDLGSHAQSGSLSRLRNEKNRRTKLLGLVHW